MFLAPPTALVYCLSGRGVKVDAASLSFPSWASFDWNSSRVMPVIFSRLHFSHSLLLSWFTSKMHVHFRASAPTLPAPLTASPLTAFMKVSFLFPLITLLEKEDAMS
jgi:hypothetical protein